MFFAFQFGGFVLMSNEVTNGHFWAASLLWLIIMSLQSQAPWVVPVPQLLVWFPIFLSLVTPLCFGFISQKERILRLKRLPGFEFSYLCGSETFASVPADRSHTHRQMMRKHLLICSESSHFLNFFHEWHSAFSLPIGHPCELSQSWRKNESTWPSPQNASSP